MVQSQQKTPPRPQNMDRRRLTPKGTIYVDAGASKALKRGKSLLAAGITKAEGHFEKGDLVAIANPEKKIIARGLTRYNAKATNSIAGQNSREIESILGYCDSDEVIHADDLVTGEAPVSDIE